MEKEKINILMYTTLVFLFALVITLGIARPIEISLKETRTTSNTTEIDLCEEYVRQDKTFMRRTPIESNYTEVKLFNHWYNLEDVKKSCTNVYK